MKELIRKIIKNGRGTYYVNLPKSLMKELKWKEKQKVSVRRLGEKVVIEDSPSQKKLF